MHFCECLPTPAQCLINYWTLKNLWEARALCDWAADMQKLYPPEYLTDRNRGLIRQYKHWVNHGNTMEYLHPESMLGWEREWVGFCRLALNLMPNNSPLYDRKSKTERKKKRERKEERKKKMKGKKSCWFGDILLFAVAFHKSKAPFVDSNLTKSQVLISP